MDSFTYILQKVYNYTVRKYGTLICVIIGVICIQKEHTARIVSTHASVFMLSIARRTQGSATAATDGSEGSATRPAQRVSLVRTAHSNVAARTELYVIT